ncbi:MAG: hypothetical protein CVU98_10060 [Firmicutes bacterium HGW-Firmicutes-3]|jgi:transposase|nr:MAG: hypothetical protein CVU98_10060 [Firmicutes bacterium HGW-Firmicutes-3]
MNEFIKSLNVDYTLVDYKNKSDTIVFRIKSELDSANCPYCETQSCKIHSRYEREIQDLPIQHKQVILLVLTRKFFCSNPECTHKTFAEKHDFASRNGQMSLRLNNHIVNTSLKLSSIESSKLLESEAIKVGKSSICSLLKKNA